MRVFIGEKECEVKTDRSEDGVIYEGFRLERSVCSQWMERLRMDRGGVRALLDIFRM